MGRQPEIDEFPTYALERPPQPLVALEGHAQGVAVNSKPVPALLLLHPDRDRELPPARFPLPRRHLHRLPRGGVGDVAAEELVGHEKLPTLRRQLRDRHPRKDRVVVEQHTQEDHLERLRHPRGGEHHEPVAEPAETFGLESGRVALGRHEVEPGRELRRQRARVVAPVKQLRHRGPPREVGAEIAIGLHHPRTRLGREPRE